MKACIRFYGWFGLAILMAGLAYSAARAEEPKEPEKKDEKAAAYPYPLNTCVVSGKKLTAMGQQGISYEYKGQPLMFCCTACIHKLEDNPNEYLKKLDEAIIAMQKPTYPMKTCLVTGDKLENPIDYVYMNRLVVFSRKECIEAFLKDPAAYLKKLDEARKAFEEKDKLQKSGAMEKDGEKRTPPDNGERKP